MSVTVIGIGEREITPDHPVPLAGFASRQNQPFTGIDRFLWVRAWWLGDERDAVLLIVADVLWWAPERERAFRERISLMWNIPADRILLHATHTHSAPQTSYVFVESLGSPDDDWIDHFESQTLAAVKDAHSDRSPSLITRYIGCSKIGYNRRVQIDEPDSPDDYDGLVDPTLTVLSVTHPDGTPRGLIFHYACHPTTTSSPTLSSEWPGVACEHLRDRFGSVSMLQGTCGDINPRMTRGSVERSFTDADVTVVAEEMVVDILRTLEGEGESLTLGAPEVSTVTVPCNVRSVPDGAALQVADTGDELDREWSRALRRFPDRCVQGQPLHISRISFGDALGLVCLSAEVTTFYGNAIRSIAGPNTLPLAYTNGMTGYIVTDTQLAKGGYEPDSSTRYFALPSPFAPGLEATVMRGIRAVIEPEVTP